MKRFILLGATAVALAVFVGVDRQNAAAASDDRAKQEILQIEQQRNQAIITGDFAALDRMTSDDYTFITLRGELRTKPEIIQGFKSGSFHYDSREISDLSFRIYGSTAVVTGRSNQNGQENGRDYSGDYRLPESIRGRMAIGKQP